MPTQTTHRSDAPARTRATSTGSRAGMLEALRRFIRPADPQPFRDSDFDQDSSWWTSELKGQDAAN